MKRRVGWYRLPRSGAPFHGTIPNGAVEIPAPVDVTPAERPPSTASKAELIAYVDSLNLDGDNRPATPNLTKSQLWALIDGTGDQSIDPGDSGPEVSADVLGDEQITDGQELGDGDVTALEPDLDGVEGHGD